MFAAGTPNNNLIRRVFELIYPMYIRILALQVHSSHQVIFSYFRVHQQPTNNLTIVFADGVIHHNSILKLNQVLLTNNVGGVFWSSASYNTSRNLVCGISWIKKQISVDRPSGGAACACTFMSHKNTTQSRNHNHMLHYYTFTILGDKWTSYKPQSTKTVGTFFFDVFAPLFSLEVDWYSLYCVC